MSSTIPDAQTNELGSHGKPEFVHTESSFSVDIHAELTIANTSSGKSSSKVYEGNLGDNTEKQVFDICLHNKSGGAVQLKKSFLEINKEKRRQEASSKEARHEHLSSGMVLLKKYISHQDQVHTESSFSVDIHAELTIANTSSGKSSSKVYEGNLGDNIEKQVFDICLHNKSGGAVKFKKSFLEINKEKRRQEASSKEARHEHLSSGMVLLKKYISHQDQVQIVKKCRELGIGEGGFYKPGYDNGAKLRLYMMCLGKNWDPQSRLYEDKRSRDGATPPEIPEEFKKMVSRAIAAAHEVIKQKGRRRVEAELPPMSPDICIVNFYTNEGKLGLHQDKDESEESIRAGLPVVSFSIGDSAEFLYNDERDESTAKKVVLESGDVLIFGGKSRRIFHGVPCINKKTAPPLLVEETNLRPGGLNLTFRQY